MKYDLMNQNRKIALIEYDVNACAITKIYEKYEFDFAPYGVYNSQFRKDINEVKALNDWFKGRGIPSFRKDLDSLLLKLHIIMPEELLDKAFGLSLSDQYWINPVEQQLKWEDINFFTNDFQFAGFLTASLSNEQSKEQIDLHSPNNTSDGMIKKAWIIENGKRVLVKGTFYPSNQEPINEWLVSKICERFGFDYCDYTIDLLENKLVSKCECFINQDEELVTAFDIFYSKQKDNRISDVDHYISILEGKGIEHAREKFEQMLIVDYLVMNIDRHMKNFGVIRDVNTLKWKRLAPIFDTGEAMQNDKNLQEMNFKDGSGKLFTNTNKKFSTYLDIIKDKQAFDVLKLKGLKEEFAEELRTYQDVMKMEDERIYKLLEGLQRRIQI